MAALESAPVASLVASHPVLRPVAPAVSAPASTPSTAENKRQKRKRGRLPAHIAEVPADKRPALDPERWLPKRERSTWQDMRAEREKNRLSGKQRRDKERLLTQGAPGMERDDSGGGSQNGGGRTRKRK
jgi:signal recognition particle subunit SRP72